MNAAFLIMSSAALAGADPIPPQYAPPIVYSGGAGCSTCGAPAPVADCCGKAHKVGLLDKLKARFSGFGKKSHGCGCTAEPACAPAPVCAPAPACNTCSTGGAARPNLFDKWKSRCCGKKSHGPSCDTCGAAHLSGYSGNGCATALPQGAMPVQPYTDPAPPKEMPKPKDKPKV